MSNTVEQVAGIIYKNILGQLAYNPDLNTLEEARRINNGDGWTFDESLDNQIRGNIIRHEGVKLSDENLMKAHKMALEWMRSESYYRTRYKQTRGGMYDSRPDVNDVLAELGGSNDWEEPHMRRGHGEYVWNVQGLAATLRKDIDRGEVEEIVGRMRPDFD